MIGIGIAALSLLIVAGGAPGPASASPTEVGTETELKRAWEKPPDACISLERDIFLRACRHGSTIRESSRALRLNGDGHTIQQTCFEKRTWFSASNVGSQTMRPNPPRRMAGWLVGETGPVFTA